MNTKERPILFSGPMVRAILDGRKSQTRRIVKPQPTGKQRVIEGLAHVTVGMNPADDGAVWYVGDCVGPGTETRCPYGSPGDVLWVRETWQEVSDAFYYKATDEKEFASVLGPWKPSIHMPRKMCRILLLIKSVRVERLQAISEADARAEGVTGDDYHERLEYYENVMPPGTTGKPTPKSEYAALWDHINGPGAWESNPWVWVVEFERVK